MLYYSTLEQETLSLLKELSKNKEVNRFPLVGGTALALQLGHRKSMDLDFFGYPLGKDQLKASLTDQFGDNFVIHNDNLNWALFVYIKAVKVDFVEYKPTWIIPPKIMDGISIASLADISAMKINAILRRATKKDFWDINKLLETFSMEQMIGFYEKKYPKNQLLISIPEAISYFDDAEDDADPICMEGLSWNSIKKNLSNAVEVFLR